MLCSHDIIANLQSSGSSPNREKKTRHRGHLVDSSGRRHGSLDGKATDVLPALLKKRDEVVNGQHDVSEDLLVGHADVSDGDTHAENLLELELNRGLDLVDLARQVISVRDRGGELAGCNGKELAYEL
jgi:hypothetical protein